MRRRILTTALAALALACGTTRTEGAGGGGAGTTSTSASSTATTGSTSSATSGANMCVSTADCTNETFCEAPQGACPSESTPGTCVPTPDDCTGEPEVAACACDGQIYVNACEANAARRDLGSQAGCTAPADPFECGAVLCAHGVEYCQSINGDRTCKPLPAGCEQPGTTCACLQPVFCVSAPDPASTQCSKSAGGDFLVECVVTE